MKLKSKNLLKTKSLSELQLELKKVELELAKLKLDLGANQLKNTSQIKITKHKRVFLKTLIHQKGKQS